MSVLSLVQTFFLIYVSLASHIGNVAPRNTLCPNQVLKKGQTLISTNRRFELGFFSPSTMTADPNQDSSSYYLGIWYSRIKPLTVVWVANREKPLNGIGFNLVLDSVGNLFFNDDARNTIFLVRLNQTVLRPSLMLLDSGNLVVKNGDGNYAWQSFDFPSDTLLPGMKLGWDLKPGKNRFLTSWRMSEDPSPGDFVFRIESPESPQLLLEKNSVTESRWGPWNGQRFSGSNAMKDNPVFRTIYRSSPGQVYFTFEMLDQSVLLRLVVNPVGVVQFLKWKSSSNAWIPMVTLNGDICDKYGSCGPYGVCRGGDRGCRCLDGFVANSPHDWHRMDATDGCGRKYPLNCSDSSDGFLVYKGLKMPDNFTVRRGLGPQECEDYCLKECACMAYANVDVYGSGVECVVWSDKLVDLKYSTRGGDEIYIRMARAEILVSHAKNKRNEDATLVSTILIAILWGLAFWGFMHWLLSLLKKTKDQVNELQNRSSMKVEDDDTDIQLFDSSTISAATNNFSADNKIGEGGFGPVYQGELPDGQKIAVKKLSENSNQGLVEFKNETRLIAQLQHRNLVKLLGCCIEGEERMLVYEYMPNKSLDEFIFEPARKSLLSWEKRFHILKGVAKGLEYLHFGSRLRVIHRDLKAGNILLDDEMNPKISDFGLARNFENEILQETTKRVIGTHGYMSPEYVIDGHYSTKSDVFSFGVLVLEIISGERNWGFHHPDHDFNLLGHAWKLWVEGRELELKDPTLEGSSDVEIEVSRCIQVGLLCVQQSSEERPTMAQVVSMLEIEGMSLAQPQEPGFFSLRSAGGSGFSTRGWNYNSNGLTITALSGRA